MCSIRHSAIKRFIFKDKIPGSRCIKRQIQINTPHSSGSVLSIHAAQCCRIFSGNSIYIGSIRETGTDIVNFPISPLPLSRTSYPKKAKLHR